VKVMVSKIKCPTPQNENNCCDLLPCKQNFEGHRTCM
jgi:hypothetical protein